MQIANKQAGHGLRRTHHRERSRNVFFATNAVQIAEEDALLQNYGCAKLHGRRKRKKGADRNGLDTGLTKRYVADRDALWDAFEHKFGWPLDRAEKDIVTHLASKKQFDATLCAEMLSWEATGLGRTCQVRAR